MPIILLPLLTKIDILFPIKVGLFLDIIGFIIAILLVNPKKQKDIDGIEIKSILQIFKETKKLKFLPFAIFTGSIWGFFMWWSVFKDIYLTDLWYPVAFLGFVMWLSRLVWFIIWRYAYLIEEHFTMKQHLFFEIFFFTICLILIAYFSNPYLIATVFIISIGYKWWRSQVITWYLLKNYISDKNYRTCLHILS